MTNQDGGEQLMDNASSARAPIIVPLNSDAAVLAQFGPSQPTQDAARLPTRIGAESDDAPLGDMFQAARRRAGLTLEQIANETKVHPRHLEAIERGALAAIPSGIYGRAIIRAYAQLVHLDPNVAAAWFDRAVGPPVLNFESIAKPTDARQPLSNYKAVSVISLIVAALIFGLAKWPNAPAPTERAQTHTVVARNETRELATTSGNPPNTSVLVASADSAPPTDTKVTAEQPIEAELIVTTDPPGGRVTVNDIGWGVTPVSIRNLPLGSKRVRITKDGYRVEERVVHLDANRSTARLRIRLRDAR